MTSEPDVDAAAVRVPFRVRIGVTGHRDLDDLDALAPAIASRLECVRHWFEPTETTPVAYTVVSALAEGADRLIAKTVLETFDDAQLEVVLPLDPEEYREDFAGPASVAEFDSSLGVAVTVVQVPAAGERVAAYELAGQTVVDSSDLVLAICDHQPSKGRGGTAEIVTHARMQGVPVPVVDSCAPPQLDAVVEGFERVAALNALSLDRGEVGGLARSARRDVEASVGRSPIHWASVGVAECALSAMVRADYLALRFQRQYNRIGAALFGASALAVASVAAQVVFEPEYPVWSIVEVVLILMILGAFGLGRRSSVHERWLGYRSLAEVLRAAPFIALTGIDEDQTSDGSVSARRSNWTQRTFSELWRGRPVFEHRPQEARELGRVLSEGWVAGQIGYHPKLIGRAERAQTAMTRTVLVLFAVTLLVATLHVAEIGHEAPWPDIFTFAAIMLPGFGAALVGISDQRQYRLHAQRSRRTAERLERIRRGLSTADDVKVIQRLAVEAQSVTDQENIDCFTVIELQELEITL